jgi:hypothetical protein
VANGKRAGAQAARSRAAAKAAEAAKRAAKKQVALAARKRERAKNATAAKAAATRRAAVPRPAATGGVAYSVPATVTAKAAVDRIPAAAVALLLVGIVLLLASLFTDQAFHVSRASHFGRLAVLTLGVTGLLGMLGGLAITLAAS